MASEHLWIAPGDIETDISGRVQLPKPGEDGFRLHSQAAEGSVGSSDILLDDPAGGFYVVGLNAYRVRETLSEADDPYIFAGHFGRRRESRNGVYRDGPSRQIFAQVQDANALLSRYVIREGEDGDRPQETDTERWEWLRGSGIFPAESDFDDTLFIIDPAGVTLSKADLQDYTAQQIIDDMAQQSGHNYYVMWDGVAEKYYVVYADDADTHLTSDLRFSNVETDADGSTTFYAGLDWELDISPERTASTVIVRYANGSTGETDDDTAAEFSRVDKVMDANLVKTEGVASVRALKYLSELDTEELELTGTVYLPASKASQFRAGMRCEMKASHLTGMSDFVWVRLHEVTIVNIAEDETLAYALAFTGVFDATVTPALTCSGVVVDLSAQVSGPLTGTSGMGGSLTPGSGSGLMVAGCALGENGTALWGPTGNLVAAATGWSEGTSRPQSDTHTGSNLAWKADGSGSPSWAMTGGGVNPAQDGRQVGVWIPGATFVQSVSGQTGVNITSGDIDWPSPLTAGNMVLIFGVAEGPIAWGGDITKNDVTSLTVIANIDGALQHAGSNVRMAVGCVDPGDTFQPNSAGSSWWFHAIEVSF